MRPGELVAGYRIEAALGAGAMGAVFKARHLATEKVVAIKTLHPGADPAARERFAREGLAMARLSHPHLLRVHAALDDLPEPALVLEFAAQGSLATRLEAGRLDPEDSIRWAAELASALAAAHAEGILHRDLKPANVLFDEEGRPKLADFGLARVQGQERLTATHEVLGTPLYMAPEQARGEAPSEAVDVYALGAVLYHCLAGRPPLLPGPTLLALLQRLQSEEPPPLSSQLEVPSRVATLCRRCLAKDPNQRPSAAELAHDLTTLDEPGQADLVFPLGVILASLGASAAVLTAVLLTRSAQPQLAGTPASTPPRVTTPTQAPAPTPSAFEFSLPDLGPGVVAQAARGSVLAEAGASLAALASVSQPELHRWAGQSAVLVEGSKRYGLSAALILAREGHTYGLVKLAAYHAPLRPSQPLDREARGWLRAAARAGDSEALFELGCANELKHGDRSLAKAYRFLGIATRPLRAPETLQADLERDDLSSELKGQTVARAWRKVWRITRPVTDEAWRQARRRVSEAPARAVEDYLVLLARAEGPEREALAEELTRAAELAWVPLLSGFTPRLTELHLPSGTESGGLDLTRALAQAERVLRRVRWCRGVLLRLELRIQARGWGPDLAPPSWVEADLAEALRLRPDSPAAHFAQFRAVLADKARAVACAALAYSLAHRDRGRSRLRDAQRFAVGVAYRHRWTDIRTARHLARHLPGKSSPTTYWRRLLIEHTALRRGEAKRGTVEELRASFREALGRWPESVLSEKERAGYLRRLENLKVRERPPSPKARAHPSTTPR